MFKTRHRREFCFLLSVYFLVGMTFSENVPINSKLSVLSLPKEQLIMHSAHTWPVVIDYWESYNFWQRSSKLRCISWAVFDIINILWHILLPFRQCEQHNFKMFEVSDWHCVSSSMVLSLNDWPCIVEVIIIHYWTRPRVWTRLYCVHKDARSPGLWSTCSGWRRVQAPGPTKLISAIFLGYKEFKQQTKIVSVPFRNRETQCS